MNREERAQDPHKWADHVERTSNTLSQKVSIVIAAIAICVFIFGSALNAFYSKQEVDDLLQKQRADIVYRLQHIQACEADNEQMHDPKNKVDCIKASFPEDAI